MRSCAGWPTARAWTRRTIVAANFIPELFHCSGFAIGGSATEDGTLYHGRILDYACDWRLQEHAVLVVAEPEGKIPFVNVTYAGFIGSVTGMNAGRISIGEMGGRGLGHWEGVPMAFLVRMALEEADDLDRAIAVFRDNPRTCEYYYVIADGESGKGVGMEASWDTFRVIAMGETHPRLPHALKDAVALSAGDRYEELVRRIKAGHGKFDARVGPGADGPAGGDEVEPAQRPLRDDDGPPLGGQRLQGRRPGGHPAVPGLLAPGTARPQARDLGPLDPPPRPTAPAAVSAAAAR